MTSLMGRVPLSRGMALWEISLTNKWSHCACSVRTVLLSIQSLLGEPNNDSPLNSYAAKLWESQEDYKRVLIKKYAEAQK